MTSMKKAQNVASPLKKKKKGVLTFPVHLCSKWLFIGFYAFHLLTISAGETVLDGV